MSANSVTMARNEQSVRSRAFIQSPRLGPAALPGAALMARSENYPTAFPDASVTLTRRCARPRAASARGARDPLDDQRPLDLTGGGRPRQRIHELHPAWVLVGGEAI